MNDLTKRQAEILYKIREFIELHHYSPSVRELASLLNISSPSSVFKQLQSLEKKGYIRQKEKSARSLELVTKESLIPEKKIPLIGSISRASKIEMFTDFLEVAFPASALPKETHCYYSFVISDTSFQSMALLLGDVLAIETRTEAHNREVVLARDLKGQAIIGNYWQEKAGCRIGEETFQDGKVMILGILTAMLRKY